MINFIVNHWEAFLLSLVTAGAIAFCKWSWGKAKYYKNLADKQEENQLDDYIDEKISPLVKTIEDLQNHVMRNQKEDESKFQLIMMFYRYQIITLCNFYLAQGYITLAQYNELSEFFKIYTELGGNGQAHEKYNKVLELDIRENDDK